VVLEGRLLLLGRVVWRWRRVVWRRRRVGGGRGVVLLLMLLLLLLGREVRPAAPRAGWVLVLLLVKVRVWACRGVLSTPPARRDAGRPGGLRVVVWVRRPAAHAAAPPGGGRLVGVPAAAAATPPPSGWPTTSPPPGRPGGWPPRRRRPRRAGQDDRWGRGRGCSSWSRRGHRRRRPRALPLGSRRSIRLGFSFQGRIVRVAAGQGEGEGGAVEG